MFFVASIRVLEEDLVGQSLRRFKNFKAFQCQDSLLQSIEGQGRPRFLQAECKTGGWRCQWKSFGCWSWRVLTKTICFRKCMVGQICNLVAIWKWMVGMRSFPFLGPAYFQELLMLGLMECNVTTWIWSYHFELATLIRIELFTIFAVCSILTYCTYSRFFRITCTVHIDTSVNQFMKK